MTNEEPVFQNQGWQKNRLNEFLTMAFTVNVVPPPSM